MSVSLEDGRHGLGRPRGRRSNGLEEGSLSAAESRQCPKEPLSLTRHNLLQREACHCSGEEKALLNAVTFSCKCDSVFYT